MSWFDDFLFTDETQAAKRVKLLQLQNLEDQQTGLLGQKRSAARLLDFAPGGSMAAQPAGLDDNTGIIWNQARPEDTAYKNELTTGAMGGALAQVQAMQARQAAMAAPMKVGKDEAIMNANGQKFASNMVPEAPKLPEGLGPDGKPIPGYLELARAKADATRNPNDSQETFGEPQVVNGPKGQQLVRFGNRGSIRPVEGYDPKNTQQERIPQGYRLAKDGTSLEFIPGGPADPDMQNQTQKGTLGKIQSEAETLLSTLGTFEKTVDDASTGDFVSAFGGGRTTGGRKLNTSWTNAALMAKGEALFNLGVLSGPDMSVIQSALPNPSTAGGALASKKAYKEAIGQVRGLVSQRLRSYQQNLGSPEQRSAQPTQQGAAPVSQPPGPAPIGKNGKPMKWVP